MDSPARRVCWPTVIVAGWASRVCTGETARRTRCKHNAPAAGCAARRPLRHKYRMYGARMESITTIGSVGLHVSSYFYCRIGPGELLYDGDRDLLAIAKFLVVPIQHQSFLCHFRVKHCTQISFTENNWLPSDCLHDLEHYFDLSFFRALDRYVTLSISAFARRATSALLYVSSLVQPLTSHGDILAHPAVVFCRLRTYDHRALVSEAGLKLSVSLRLSESLRDPYILMTDSYRRSPCSCRVKNRNNYYHFILMKASDRGRKVKIK